MKKKKVHFIVLEVESSNSMALVLSFQRVWWEHSGGDQIARQEAREIQPSDILFLRLAVFIRPVLL